MHSELTTATEGTVDWEGMQTWYRVVGDLDPASALAPVVICHGGPGGTHDYLESVADLARRGRACVFYDQFGNGRSGRRPDAPSEVWSVCLFIRELERLVDHLGISDRFHLLGQSWGSMLALEVALRHPAGLRSVVAADPLASMSLYSEEAKRLIGELPDEVRDTLERHHSAGTADSPEYQEAALVYYRAYSCRLDPWPEEILRSFAYVVADPTVYTSMVGPSEFHVTGSLRDWDITDRLPLINVPVLVISGRFDQCTPRIVEPIARGIPGAEWLLFESSSHTPHLEEHDRFIDEVDAFLARVDAR